MQSAQNLFFRDDTLFGVCEAIGEDFRFNPFYLRVALAVSLIWAPIAVLGFYGAAAVVVLLSRVFVPNPRKAAAQDEVCATKAVAMQPAGERETPKAGNEAKPDVLAFAA